LSDDSDGLIVLEPIFLIDGLPYILNPITYELKRIEITSRHDVGSVKWIIEEPDQTDWFSSPKGIIKYDEMSQKSTLYPTKNVGGTTWDNPRPVVVSKGIIYCSGYKGISILDPEALQEVVASTQVRISNLLVIQQKKDTVFNKNENIPINLSYNENDIDISMTNLLLVEQSKCKYVYRLLPRDDE
jgi:hypothetical protein